MTLPVMHESTQPSTLAGRRVLLDVQGLCSELSWLVGKAPDLLCPRPLRLLCCTPHLWALRAGGHVV